MLQSLQQFLIKLLNSSPPTAHCLARQMQFLLPKLLELPTDHQELTFLLVGAVPDLPTMPRLLPFCASGYREELLLLLLATGQATVLRRIETEERQRILESSATQLESLLADGIDKPKQLFNSMIFTNRHFVLYLLVSSFEGKICLNFFII